MEEAISRALTNLEATLVKYQTEVNLDLVNFKLHTEHLSDVMQFHFILSVALTVFCSAVLLAIVKLDFAKKSELHLALNRVSNLEQEVVILRTELTSVLDRLNESASLNNTDFAVEDIEEVEYVEE